MGKQKKEHRKKVAKRNEQLNMQQNRMKKAQQEFIQMIEKEKAAGKFDNPIAAPLIDIGQGPQI